MLNHTGTKRIITDRLVLRQFQSTDVFAVFNNWASDERVTKYLTWLPHSSICDTENIVNLWVSKYNEMSEYNWAIVLKDINEPIGGISVVEKDENTATIGYCIGYDWWGKGITTEAFSAVIEYLLDEVGFSCIRAYHSVLNPASGRVMRKCGLTYQNTLTKYSKDGFGILHDVDEYILKKQH
jgi:ribosomal-protein-alanine N-acetyltransferase